MVIQDPMPAFHNAILRLAAAGACVAELGLELIAEHVLPKGWGPKARSSWASPAVLI